MQLPGMPSRQGTQSTGVNKTQYSPLVISVVYRSDPGSRFLSSFHHQLRESSAAHSICLCLLDQPPSELVLHVPNEVSGRGGHAEEGGGGRLCLGGAGRQVGQGREIQVLVLVVVDFARLLLHHHHDVVLLLGRRRGLAPRPRAALSFSGAVKLAANAGVDFQCCLRGQLKQIVSDRMNNPVYKKIAHCLCCVK